MDQKGVKPVIAIDIDDVLAASAAGFVAWSNERYGTHLAPDDYREHWAELWKVEVEELERRAVEFHESGHPSTYGALADARTVLEKLKERYSLVIITSRRASIEKLTREWIDKNYPGIFDQIIFAGFYDSVATGRFNMTKTELAKSVRADFLIDDQLKHIEAAAAAGIKGLLFGEYAWNKKDVLPEGVVRAKDWREVMGYFEGA